MYPIRLRNCRYCWHLVFNNACNKTVTATTDPSFRIIILVDAGHGGEDGGTSVRMVQRKDINLAVTLRLKAMLESAGFQVKMTQGRLILP